MTRRNRPEMAQPRREPLRPDVGLAAEFRRAPAGPHSPELQRLLNVFRGPPLAGRHVLVCTKPHREWRLARLTGKPEAPVEILEHAVFTDPDEAEWTVFRLRWKAHTGAALVLP